MRIQMGSSCDHLAISEYAQFIGKLDNNHCEILVTNISIDSMIKNELEKNVHNN